MEDQLAYYDETGKDRDRFDQGLPAAMDAYSAFRKKVYKDGALTDYINSLKVGQTIQVTYYRGNTKSTVAVTLTQAPS